MTSHRMNLWFPRAIALFLLGGGMARAAEVDHDVIDAGGGQSSSASYRNLGSIGGIGGLSSGPVSGVVNRAGFAAQLNETPDLPVRTLKRSPGLPLKISLDLLGGVADPEGDALAVESISGTSVAGVVVRPDGRWLVYEAPPGAPTSDTFTYLLIDSIGDRVQGTVSIIEELAGDGGVGESRTLLHIESIVPTMDYRISFAGIPGRSYRVETTTNLVDGPWATLSFGLAGPDGLYAVTNTPAMGEGARFYRSFHRP
jgi:hypothetical protein